MNRWVAFFVLISMNLAAAQDSTPRALFTITPAEPEVGQEVSLDASFSFDRGGGGSILVYTWDFGDGSNPVVFGAPTTSHAYDAAGLYTITLTVVDNDSPPHEGLTERTIVVVPQDTTDEESANHPPTAVFSVSTALSAVGDEVEFDASESEDEDGDTLQYAWDFGDGTTQDFGTDATTEHTYGAEGEYEVRLFVCDQESCELAGDDLVASESFKRIEVLAAGSNLPPTAIIASGPRTANVGQSLSFDGQLSFDPNDDQLDFAWDVRLNGVLIDQVLTAILTRNFDQVGTYEIELEVFDGRGGSDRADPITVQITEAPAIEEPPASNPNPGSNLDEPADSALQRPTLTTCGVGMIPPMLAGMLGLVASRCLRRLL